MKTKIYAQTRKEKYYIERYKNSSCDSVKDYYKYPAEGKIAGEKYIKDLMKVMDGYGYRILSGNAYHFTAGFRHRDFETGYLMLCVATPYKNFDILYH